MAEKHKSPGVYITEQNAIPNSVVSVPTAVPAFVGYTPQAEYQGKSYLNVPVKITSWNEFLAIFCFPQKTRGKHQQYSPNYFVIEENVSESAPNSIRFENRNLSICPDPSTIYYLYLSVLIFYQNGGSDAYIVSVGSYGKAQGRALGANDPLVNPNVSLDELLKGLNLLKKETEPTMYVIPESTLLPSNSNATLMQAMLLQCEELGTAISLLDVPGGRNLDIDNFEQAIEGFRASTGSNGLSYGAAYFPFVDATVLQAEDLNYTNFFGGELDQLAAILNPKNTDPSLTSIFEMINDTNNQSISVNQLNNALLSASKLYSILFSRVLDQANILPASGGMAGVISMIDNTIGVWKSPANVSITSVKGLPIQVNHAQQELLNIDPVSGKSINVIRSFIGQGVLVWGARTLDGNSVDFKYIAVRRTLIYLEQSCKLAVESYVFQPNDANTWSAVKSMINNFLTNVWKEGGLAGASPQDAFTVECGLGTTMTANDILEGLMNITVKVAILHPAEYIVLTFRQKMASSS